MHYTKNVAYIAYQSGNLSLLRSPGEYLKGIQIRIQIHIRFLAKRHGLHATFMPKPKNGVNGSGMHLHLSLSRDGVNLFEDKGDKYGLSQEAFPLILLLSKLPTVNRDWLLDLGF